MQCQEFKDSMIGWSHRRPLADTQRMHPLLEVSDPAASLPAVARAQPQGLINRKGPRVEWKLMLTQDSPGASQVTARPIRTEIKAALSPKLAHSSVTNILRVDFSKSTVFESTGLGSDLGPKLGLSWQFIGFSKLQFPSRESGNKIPYFNRLGGNVPRSLAESQSLQRVLARKPIVAQQWEDRAPRTHCATHRGFPADPGWTQDWTLQPPCLTLPSPITAFGLYL